MPWVPVAFVAMMLFVAALVGYAVGNRVSTASLDTLLLTADDTAKLWTEGGAGVAPVGQVRDELANNGNVDAVKQHTLTWLETYDGFIGSLQAGGVPPAADGVRRLLLSSAQLSRDAVESLAAAAAVNDKLTRELLIAQTDRLHARALQDEYSARTLLAALRGEQSDLPAPPPMPPLHPQVMSQIGVRPPGQDTLSPDSDVPPGAVPIDPSQIPPNAIPIVPGGPAGPPAPKNVPQPAPKG